MGKRIIETLLGFVTAVLGFFLAFLNFSDIPNSSIFSISLSLTLIIIGVGLLFIVGRRDHEKVIFPEISPNSNGKSLLEKNHEMMQTYDKTSKMRDKLRVIRHTK